MEIMKIAYVILMIWALMTFWPLVVLLVIGLAVFLAYSSWKTKKLMNEVEMNVSFSNANKNDADIIEAEYTEKEIEHDKT